MAKKTFEEAMNRLEEIVEHLENNDIELSKAMAEFKEGLELVDSCEKDLKEFDKQIEALIKKHDGEDHE